MLFGAMSKMGLRVDVGNKLRYKYEMNIEKRRERSTENQCPVYEESIRGSSIVRVTSRLDESLEYPMSVHTFLDESIHCYEF